MVIVTTTTDIPPRAAPPHGTEPERLLIDFLNTLDVEDGTDALTSDADYRDWSADHGVVPGERAEAIRLRDALRAVVSSGLEGIPTSAGPGRAPDDDPNPPASTALPEVPLTARLTAGGVILTGDTGPREAVAIATMLDIQGRLARVKLCPCDDCRWAFYDRSRNGSRTWCDMAVCGNRVKARTFRSKPGER